MIMAVFAYLYYWNFVGTRSLTVGQSLSVALKLTDKQQLELFGKLGNLLVGEGVLPASAMAGVYSALRAANVSI